MLASSDSFRSRLKAPMWRQGEGGSESGDLSLLQSYKAAPKVFKGAETNAVSGGIFGGVLLTEIKALSKGDSWSRWNSFLIEVLSSPLWTQRHKGICAI